ncbi:MAG: SCP2 sterol-binding domain-containing protein [Desulfurococcales archaeon]|nr:SCP2 sterol-binding domain-containing protein [Desulfurococcales archaeon]
MFPDLDWARRLCDAASRDEYLREIGRGFTEVIGVIVVMSDGSRRALLFNVVDGRCSGVREAGVEEALREADIALEASLETWLSMLRWRLTPTRALFTGKLRVVKGSRFLIFSRPIAHYQLLYLASRIE